MKRILSKEKIGLILIALFFCVSLLPIGNALDIVAPQWVYLSLLNIIVYYFLERNDLLLIFKNNNIYNKFFFYLLAILIIFSLLSFYSAINLDESIIEFSRLVIIITSLICLISLFELCKKFKNKIIDIITIFLVIELVAIFIQIINLGEFGIFNVQTVKMLTGFTGNKNIAAVSISIKIPFIAYRIFNTKNNLLIAINLIISIFSYYLIFLLGSRATILGVFIVLLVNFVFLLRYKLKLRYLFVYIIPLLISLLFNFFIQNPSSTNLNLNRQFETTINYNSSKSAVDRIRYYKYSLDMFLENPVLGIGIGNWKIVSLKYDGPYMKNYIVPYHAHNDFFQKFSEIGFFGGLSYLLIVIFYPLLILFKKFNFTDYYLAITTCLCLAIYFIDSNFNFPIARPINIIMLLIGISFAQLLVKNKNE